MSALSRVVAGFRALAGRSRVNADLEEEVRHYVELSAAANRSAGMSREEAMRAALASVGSIGSVQAPARGFGWDVAVENLGQDVRYATRFLRKSPGFTLAAALSLAFGIGANTAIFSLVNATLIKRMPVANSQELVTVGSPGNSGVYSYPAFQDVLRADAARPTPSFSGITAFGGITVSMSEGDATDLVSGAIVTGNYFNVLGVKPALGRLLTESDDQRPGAHPVAVISAGLWKRRFGKRADVVGKPIRLNGQPFTIVGVTPEGFYGVQQANVRDVFVPMMMQAWMRPPRARYSGEMDPDLLSVRGNNWLYAVGRLAPDVSMAQAAASTTAIVRGMRDWQGGQSEPKVTLAKLDDGPPGQREQLLSVARLLGGVVLAVLIIACANVANLLLSRATARRKEIAVRLALGATRSRLVRQLLAESVLLSTVGGALGLALAYGAILAVRKSPPPPGALPVALDFAIDARVLLFTFSLSVITGVVFGLVPALHASRPDLVPALKDGESAARRRRFSGRNALVVAQTALSLVLLVSAALFTRSLAGMRRIDAGFDVDRLLSVPLNIQLLRYTRTQGKAFYREVVSRVEALPGVESAAIVRWTPLSGGGSSGSLHIRGKEGGNLRFQSEGSPIDLANPEVVSNDLVGVGYFRTMGIAMRKGRDFTTADDSGAPPVAIVNETFVRTHFANEDPIGQRISMSGPEGPWTEVVGVVADSKYTTLDEKPTRIVYLPAAQNYTNGMTLVVRTKVDPATVVTPVSDAVQSLDRSLPVAGVRTMSETLGTSIYVARAGAVLLSGFGVLALLLSSVGLYGVLAYNVSRRTREFGLRMALGAQRRNVLAGVMLEGVLLVAAGVVGGLVAAMSATGLLRKFLYEVSPTDTATFVSAPLLLMMVAVVACAVPAWRATRVDPMRALRED